MRISSLVPLHLTMKTSSADDVRLLFAVLQQSPANRVRPSSGEEVIRRSSGLDYARSGFLQGSHVHSK